MDYESIGLLVGLEVHRQLNTKHKMFCECPTAMSTSESTASFTRMLRPTQSELGQLDAAAAFEFRKQKRIVYSHDKSTSCLVEMDEEPPHDLNPGAIEVALTISTLLKANVLDEIHVMRKIVIDGSNTSGFQRTCIVSLGGEIMASEERIPILQVSLEEDAARKISETEEESHYNIDRLGIPLVEVTTAPVITSPAQTVEVARNIGRILRATGRVKRGIGSVRQDLNISTREGALVEVKGVQELELLSKIVEFEAQRQTSLLRIREELVKRRVDAQSLRVRPVFLTPAFEKTACKIVKECMKTGGEVWGIKLNGFGGLLKRELNPGTRLGTELARRASAWGGVGGLFHSDELPSYGITKDEKEAALKMAGTEPTDALVIVADRHEKCMEALNAVIERAIECLSGVPAETRAPNPDGATRYMRPRPGAARMYPETDVPSVPVTQDMLARVRANLPRLPDQIAKEIQKEYGLSSQLTEELLDSDQLELFEKIIKELRLPAPVVAASLTETMKSLQRDGIDAYQLSDEDLTTAFRLISEGATAKESLPEILRWMVENPGQSARSATEALGLEMLHLSEVEKTVAEVVLAAREGGEEGNSRIRDKAIGEVMRKLRGKVDPALVVELVERELRRKHASNT